MTVFVPRAARNRTGDDELVESALRRVSSRPLNRRLVLLGALFAPLEVLALVTEPHRGAATTGVVVFLAATGVPGLVRAMAWRRRVRRIAAELRRGDVDGYRDAARSLDQAGERAAAQAALRIAQSRCTDPPQILYYAAQAQRLGPAVSTPIR